MFQGLFWKWMEWTRTQHPLYVWQTDSCLWTDWGLLKARGAAMVCLLLNCMKPVTMLSFKLSWKYDAATYYLCCSSYMNSKFGLHAGNRLCHCQSIDAGEIWRNESAAKIWMCANMSVFLFSHRIRGVASSTFASKSKVMQSDALGYSCTQGYMGAWKYRAYTTIADKSYFGFTWMPRSAGHSEGDEMSPWILRYAVWT